VSHFKDLFRVRRLDTIKRRLAEAEQRNGLRVPGLVPITFESLQSIKEQLEAHLVEAITPRGPMQ
jgi:hypothetical protein